MNKKEKEWCDLYNHHTGFDPTIKAMKMALEVLEIWSDAKVNIRGRETIKALREALAQPEQSPAVIAKAEGRTE